MSAAEHRHHAQQHQDLSDRHVALTVPVGEPVPIGARLWSTSNAHSAQAGRHAEHANQHVAAAKALESAEDTECREAPEGSRATCPLHAGIDAIDAIEGGVRLHLQEGTSVEAAVAGLRCHLARAATLGREGMPACPLYAEDLRVQSVTGTRDVDVIAPDAAAAAALQHAVLESSP